MTKLNINDATTVRTYGEVIKAEWHENGNLCASAIYGFDGSFQGSMVQGGNYEVPADIKNFIKEII
jgi:hypothetical protein